MAGKEVLRMCCQCGIFDLKEGATFEEVENRIEIYKKGGKEVISTPVKGLRFVNFFSMFPATVIGAERFNLSMTSTHLMLEIKNNVSSASINPFQERNGKKRN